MKTRYFAVTVTTHRFKKTPVDEFHFWAKNELNEFKRNRTKFQKHKISWAASAIHKSAALKKYYRFLQRSQNE